MTPIGMKFGILALSGVASTITYSPPMTGLKLWYAADNVNSGSAQPADGDPVGTWMNLAPFTDPAGTDSNLSQSTAANQPNFREAVPYASGAFSTAKTVPGMKWSNNNGNSVDTWMSTTGSLFGGSITGGGMNDFTRYIVLSNCWAYIDGYQNYITYLYDNGFYNEGGSATDSTQRNNMAIRKIGSDYGFRDYAMHGQMAKTSGNKDFWYGYINTTSTPPHEWSMFDSSSLNSQNMVSVIANRWQISGTQSLSVNAVQLASYNETSMNERSGITGLTCGAKVNFSSATNAISANSGWDGYIHELLVYTGSSEEQYRQVHEYIGQKYGIANSTGSIFPHKNSLLRWWKADEGVTATGGYIDKWDDFGTSGNHAYPNTSGSAFAKPQLLTSELNGKDIVYVGSASGQLQSFFEYTSSDSPGPEDPHTMIALYQPQTLTAAVHKPKSNFPVTTTYQASPLIMETNTDDQLLSLQVGGHSTWGNRIGGGMVRVSGSVYGYANAQEALETVQNDEWQLFAMTNAAQGDYSFENTGSDFNTGTLPRVVQLRWQTDPFDGNSSGLPFPASTNNQKYRHNGYNNANLQSFVSSDFKDGGASWPSASSGADVAKGRIGRAIWDEYNTTSWNTNCKIAEIMVFKQALTRQELQQVAMYLQQKWGINLG